MRPNRPRNPSGMLMGPNDPFFEEGPRQLRAPGSTAPRYDTIGPFGREPDPSIDPSLHPWSPTANRGGMMGRGPGPFPGPGGPFF
ncbi:hypothetical protein, conserved [Babesia bigemina]|uniref:Uncharacterized protein n=1 Tax=Babesia bigemina TaxID=5866 RepID=A0A061D8U5_BABBI|nr:hypothetical protein, conserved [Babesia bigemina]CDR96968.1 hypothetical protein, conserved [Babesia bigemina]|eukprot:XP_012769154.1 hypothetical protein, conserved [Babesia bigemina]